MVAADFSLRTLKGAATFEYVRTGLPNVYDIL